MTSENQTTTPAEPEPRFQDNPNAESQNKATESEEERVEQNAPQTNEEPTSPTSNPTEIENRKLREQIDSTKNELKNMKTEKDALFAELCKVNTLKNRLEGLCREFQKQNKLHVEESKRIGNEEQIKRFELSQKFEVTLQEITAKIDQEQNERRKQQKENDSLREKLNKFMGQYEVREQYSESQLKAKDLESQLVEAKLLQQLDIANQEAIKSKRYKEQAELLEIKLKQQREIFFQEALKSQTYLEQIGTLMRTETELRTQLALYAEKFDQFQETLTKSNDVFNTFKQEMDRMTKTISRYEKENSGLKKKCEQTDLTLIELAEERNSQKKQIETLKIQNKKLESLCRALQNERKKTSNPIDQSNTDSSSSTAAASPSTAETIPPPSSASASPSTPTTSAPVVTGSNRPSGAKSKTRS